MTQLRKILGTIDRATLHRESHNEPFKVMDIMTVEELDSHLHDVTYSNVIKVVAAINKELAAK